MATYFVVVVFLAMTMSVPAGAQVIPTLKSIMGNVVVNTPYGWVRLSSHYFVQ